MKIGIVGYQGSGKSTLFELLTGCQSNPAMAHQGQTAMATVHDQRFEPIKNIYRPKKGTVASLEMVDTPGLSPTHEGNACPLALLRETGTLLVVINAFDQGNSDTELRQFDEDLRLADLEIISGRIARLTESASKPRPNQKEANAELEILQPLADLLEASTSLNRATLSDAQRNTVRSFGLLTLKPRLVVRNLADDDPVPPFEANDHTIGFSVRLQCELARMEAGERRQLMDDMDLTFVPPDTVMQKILHTAGQTLFFTAGDKEVRSWLIHTGGTALEAAGNIHSDLARGFIRAETMASSDLIRLGSEREMKAQGLVRDEPKDYVVQDGDILLIKFSI